MTARPLGPHAANQSEVSPLQAEPARMARFRTNSELPIGSHTTLARIDGGGA